MVRYRMEVLAFSYKVGTEGGGGKWFVSNGS